MMAAETDNAVPTDDAEEVFAGDPVLTFLVEASALADLDLEVSLLVDGMTVTGRLIDELTFIRRLADHVQQEQEAQSGQAAGRHGLADMLRDQIRGFPDGAVIGSDYVHLDQVTISHGAGDVTRVALWRGAVEDISGWGVVALHDVRS